MKKILLFIAIFAVSLNMQAQEKMFVWQNGAKTDFVVTDVDSITFNQLTGNGHEYVDLGLPSGTLWATCNVGANKPEEYGDYFAWGETEPKSTYTKANYKWFSNGDDHNITKYNYDSSYGIVDNNNTIDLSDDAAHMNMGGYWRMPTLAELDELRNSCKWTWTTKNGVNGCKVTSLTNGNSIFLPAAGNTHNNSLEYASNYGFCWSSTLITATYPLPAYGVYFGEDVVYRSYYDRYFGLSVRGVCKNPSKQHEMYVWQNGGKTTFVVADVDSVTFGKENTPPATGTENGYEWVDLGLSVKWATCNVGATKPEEYGDYFAWGETQPKSIYDWSSYKYCNGSSSTLTKYNTVSSLGTVDNKTTLELSDDAARANWGGSWRMPTDAELTELCEQCTWTWTRQNGVYGYKVTSKKSGYTNKSIFLPGAGYRSGSSLLGAGSIGSFWLSSLETIIPGFACGLYFSSDRVGRDDCYIRNYGLSVRPVCQ